MIIVRANRQPGKEVTYDLVQERTLAKGMTLSDAEWLAGLVNQDTAPKQPPAHTEEAVRTMFDQDVVNAKLDGFTAEASRPTSASFEGVPGCGCVLCTIYWQQKDRARRNPIQYPRGKS